MKYIRGIGWTCAQNYCHFSVNNVGTRATNPAHFVVSHRNFPLLSHNDTQRIHILIRYVVKELASWVDMHVCGTGTVMAFLDAAEIAMYLFILLFWARIILRNCRGIRKTIIKIEVVQIIFVEVNHTREMKILSHLPVYLYRYICVNTGTPCKQ